MNDQAIEPSPPKWRVSRLGDLCSVLNGLAFKPDEWVSRGLPIIRIQNLNGSEDFNYFDGPLPRRYVIPAGTLLFSWSGNRGTSFGPYVWNGPEGALNQHIFRVTTNDSVDERWLFFALDEVRKKVERAAHGGSGLVHVRRGDFLSYEVVTPPLPEQRLIAQILDTVDEAIRKTEQLIAKLKQVKQGLLHDLLTRGIDENGELRDPERHPEQFKDSPLGRIPCEWEVFPLGTVVPKATYGVSASLGSSPGIPVLRMNNLRGGEVDLSELKYSSAKQAEDLPLYPGDVLFNRTNSIDHVGRTGIWRGQLEKASFASYLVRLEPDALRLNNEFLNRWLNWELTQLRIRRFATPGVHQVNINPTNLRKTEIGLPRSLEEQEFIASRVAAVDDRSSCEEQTLHKLKLLKTALSNDLLTGRVRVTPLLPPE